MSWLSQDTILARLPSTKEILMVLFKKTFFVRIFLQADSPRPHPAPPLLHPSFPTNCFLQQSNLTSVL